MSQEELQNEEREVLSSIYDGDECFKQISPKTYQYKYGENETLKSFLLELTWTESYPKELPNINMDTFYNKHIIPTLKEKIVKLVATEAQEYLGMSMTYSLFEFVKDKFEELINDQPEHVTETIEVDKLAINEDEQESVKKEKKEQLTKAQKRRQWNRLDSKGEKPRGWNWVDLVKHLSQTGSKDDTMPTS